MKLLALLTNFLAANRTNGGRSRALETIGVGEEVRLEPTVQAVSDVGNNFSFVGLHITNNGEQVEIKRNRDKTLSVNIFDGTGHLINSDSGVILPSKQLQLTFTGRGTRQNGTIRFEKETWTKINEDRIVKNLG